MYYNFQEPGKNPWTELDLNVFFVTFIQQFLSEIRQIRVRICRVSDPALKNITDIIWCQ